MRRSARAIVWTTAGVRRLGRVMRDVGRTPEDARQTSTSVWGARLGSTALVGALAYMVIFGGTGPGELHPVLRLTNAALGAGLAAALLLLAPRRADRVDLAVVGALLLFALAGVLSSFPRQSFDAVLAALAYAAAFYLARGLLADERARARLVATMVGLSLAITLVFAAAWLPAYVELWRLTGVVPALDIPWSAGPWGHRYDAVLLLALLYPAWWLGRPSALRQAAATVVGFVGLLLLLIAGSRTIWIAVAAAVGVVLVPWFVGLLRRRSHVRLAAAAVAALGVVALIVIGSTPFVDRLLRLETAGARLAMWRPLIELWTDAPLAGVGPGSFPWALQLTSYFDTNAHAPRHPDSVLFQILPEAGLLGVAAIVVTLAGLGWAVARSGSWLARWVLALAVVASIGNNPTDFAFLVVPGIAWAAYAVPRADPVEPAAVHRPSRAYLMGVSVTSALIVAAYASTLFAALKYEEARAAVGRGAPAVALSAMETAAAFDPGMALYARQAGALSDTTQHATQRLEATVMLNPSDDVGWRALSLSREAARKPGLSGEAIQRAVEVQRSDYLNLLLAARHARLTGRPDEAMANLAEVVHAWPGIVAAPGWQDMVPEGMSTAEVVDAAADRWVRGYSILSWEPGDQGLLLAAMSGRSDVLRSALDRSPWGERETAGFLALAGCDVDASSLLKSPVEAELRRSIYWSLRVRKAHERGAEDRVAARVLQLMSGGGQGSAPLLTNPLGEGQGWSADRWGYRRYPLQLPAGSVMLPTPEVGKGRWLSDPAGAAASVGLTARLDNCRVR